MHGSPAAANLSKRKAEMVQHGTDTPTRRFATRHGTLCCNTNRHGTNTTRARTGRLEHGTARHAANTTRANTANRDKWLVQKKKKLEKKFAPGSEAAWDKRLLQRKSDF